MDPAQVYPGQSISPELPTERPAGSRLRLLQSLQAASGDPAISTSRRADHLRLRESSVGSPEESDAAGQTAGMCVSLDAGSMEKGEVQFQ